MPAFSGNGPLGKGPLSGKGQGFCILKKTDDARHHVEGYIGIKGKLYFQDINQRKEVNDMPRGNGTGPNGMGPMTGRAAGFCAGYQMPGYANPTARRGFGGGFGHGMGLGFRRGRSFIPNFGFGYAQNAVPFGMETTPQQEIEALQSQSQGLEDMLNQIKKRITELEKEKTSK